MDHAGKNFPRPTAETEYYWQGCRQHKLRIQRCADCGQHQFYPRIICAQCMSEKVEWVESSGHGKIISYSVIRRALSAAYAAEVPYVVVLIQLQEGPTMMSSLLDCNGDDVAEGMVAEGMVAEGMVAVGMAVEVVFEDWSEEISMPKFRLVLPP